jgi:hypothetical protein
VVAGDFLDIAEMAALPLANFEATVLGWQAQNLVRYRPVGRTLLLERLPAPGDAEARIADLLARRAAIAAGAHHRHRGLRRDPPVSPRPPGRVSGRRGAQAVRRLRQLRRRAARANWTTSTGRRASVLLALADQGWGRRTLTRLLRGDPAAGERAQQAELPTARWLRTGRAQPRPVDRQPDGRGVDQHAHSLSHGGVVLELSCKGCGAAADAAMNWGLLR